MSEWAFWIPIVAFLVPIAVAIWIGISDGREQAEYERHLKRKRKAKENLQAERDELIVRYLKRELEHEPKG